MNVWKKRIIYAWRRLINALDELDPEVASYNKGLQQQEDDRLVVVQTRAIITAQLLSTYGADNLGKMSYKDVEARIQSCSRFAWMVQLGTHMIDSTGRTEKRMPMPEALIDRVDRNDLE